MSCRRTVGVEGETGVSVGLASAVGAIAVLIIALNSRMSGDVVGDTGVSVGLASVVGAIAALTVAPISGVGATVACVAGAWVGKKAQDMAKSPAKERHLAKMTRFKGLPLGSRITFNVFRWSGREATESCRRACLIVQDHSYSIKFEVATGVANRKVGPALRHGPGRLSSCRPRPGNVEPGNGNRRRRSVVRR